MSSLKGKTLFITGASRGIGKAIGLRAAQDGANVVIASKTKDPHPKLEGTIFTAAEEMEKAGGKALPICMDVRYEEQVEAAVAQAVEKFGGIDILVNNAGAIMLQNTLNLPMKRFDLMHQINARGSFLCAQKCIPHMKSENNPHILNLSPPVSLDAKWLKDYGPYTVSKYTMSFWVKGMAAEFADKGIAVNALWPRTTIATAAVANILGGEQMIQRSRTPEIMSDAAHWIFTQEAKSCTGNWFIDEEIMEKMGVNNLDKYALNPGQDLQRELFVEA